MSSDPLHPVAVARITASIRETALRACDPRRIDPDPDGLLRDRVALHVRLGRPGQAPWPRWGATAALLDLEVFGTVRMLERAAYAALAVQSRLGIPLTHPEDE